MGLADRIASQTTTTAAENGFAVRCKVGKVLDDPERYGLTVEDGAELAAMIEAKRAAPRDLGLPSWNRLSRVVWDESQGNGHPGVRLRGQLLGYHANAACACLPA